MIRRFLHIVITAALGLGLIVILAGPVEAQGTPAVRAQADVEAGLNVVDRVTNKGTSHVYSGGFYAGASFRLKALISVMALVSGEYDKRDTYTANLYSYSGGARFDFMAPTGRVRPFAQILLGLGQDNGIDAETPNKTNYYPYLAPGVGTDLAVHRRLSVRVRFEVPILMRYSDSYTGLRFSAGIAIPIGGR
jgi:hypothetical protein